MDKVSIRLQVYFEEPFWVGICERIVDDRLSVCKITFGTEPKDYEVAQYIVSNWYYLKFSNAVEMEVRQIGKMNPKRLQRSVRKQMNHMEIGTKSQQALKLQYEEGKMVRKQKTRQIKEEEKERMFALKQQKRKEKHKGR